MEDKDVSNQTYVIKFKKMSDLHQNSNQSKSINGNKFEKEFTKLTGLTKVLKKDKPTFKNSHGNEQIIDFDFILELDEKKIFIDISTTFRSDRLKQKSYNALMYKTKIKNDPSVQFYMIVKTFTERGKTKKPILTEGIDRVMDLENFLKLLK